MQQIFLRFYLVVTNNSTDQKGSSSNGKSRGGKVDRESSYFFLGTGLSEKYRGKYIQVALTLDLGYAQVALGLDLGYGSGLYHGSRSRNSKDSCHQILKEKAIVWEIRSGVDAQLPWRLVVRGTGRSLGVEQNWTRMD